MNTEKRYQCRHIFTAGNRCGSPALRNENFCYYHHTTRKPAPPNRPLSPFDLQIPLPEDRASIQSTIGQVLQRIAANQIDPRRAGLLLYGLSIAASVLPKPQQQTKTRRNEAPSYAQEPQFANQFVHDIVDHPDHGPLAPQTLMPNPEDLQPKSLAGELLRALRTGKHLSELEDMDNAQADNDNEEEDLEDHNQTHTETHQPEILPTLQATGGWPTINLSPLPNPKRSGAPSFASFAKGGKVNCFVRRGHQKFGR